MTRSVWFLTFAVFICLFAIASARGGRRRRDKPVPSATSYSSSDDLHLAVAELDKRLVATLDKIKEELPFVISSVEEDIAKDNRDKLIIGLANFLGMAFGISVVVNDRPLTALTAGEQVQLAGQLLYGYGYWGPFLLDLEEAHVDCGKYELEKVLHEYAFLTDLGATYSFLSHGGGNSGYINADNDTHLLRYYLSEFNHSMKRALYCLVKRDNQDAKTLATYIDLYTHLAGERLTMTQEIIDAQP